MTRKLKVALLANAKENAPREVDQSSDQWDDLDSLKTIMSIVAAIEAGGHECRYFEGNLAMVESLQSYQPDICFNICEGHYGDGREAQIPAILEMMRLPYTGSKVMTLALSLDKPMTKRVLFWHELPTPEFQVFERVDEPLNEDLHFPLFVKPSREGTGMGVSSKSIVYDEKELRQQIEEIISHYKQPVLAERYIEGREVTVGLVGNLIRPSARRMPHDENLPRILKGLHFFPPMEVDLSPFRDQDIVYSNRLKVQLADQLNYLCPAPLDPQLTADLNWYAAAVFRVIGALDVSRIDFRLDANNNWKPYILEINPLPGLSPGISDIVIEAETEGISHTELVNIILNTALKRYGITHNKKYIL